MSDQRIIEPIALPPELSLWLQREARRQKCSVSALVEQAVWRDLFDTDETPLGARDLTGKSS